MNPLPNAIELQDRIRQLEEEAQRSRALVVRLEARDTVTRIVADSPSLTDAAPRILRAMGELLDWQLGLFWISDTRAASLRCISIWSDGQFSRFIGASEGRTFPMGAGLPGRVWSMKEAQWVGDLERDDNLPRAAVALRDGLHCGFAFPIIAGEEVAGVIEFFSTVRREPDTTLLEMSVIIGHQIGVFLQRTRAEKQLRRQARMSALRADVAASLTHSGDLGTVLTRCTDAVVEHVGAAFARIWIFNPGENVLELQASSGLYTHIDGAHSRIRVGAFKIGWIAEKRQPHLTNDVAEDPRVTDQYWARREGMQAFAGYPLLVEDRLMGVLALFARRKLEPLELDELAPISDAIAQFLDRRRAEEGLRRSEALKSAILATAFDAIVAMSHTGRVLEFNPAAESMFGYKRADALGQSIAELIVPPQLRESHRMGLARYLSSGESRILGRPLEITAMRADGTEFRVELAVARIPGDGPPMFTAFIRDLSTG
jgi:PAS domain S-box-containing protein